MYAKQKNPVYIEWEDACSPGDSGWQNAAKCKLLRPSRVISVGWIIQEGKKSLVMASGKSPCSVDGVTCIPKANIVKRVTLKVPR